ncbi:F-box only protein 31 [Striga asiatica]|uniref:F-box only protein 31 n=1 Tax=Striga asiatica TaxID=4170 RepID=A0A5A7PI52_STRAF|nr:F-box only protein 31 [Striga asiatica]
MARRKKGVHLLFSWHYKVDTSPFLYKNCLKSMDSKNSKPSSTRDATLVLLTTDVSNFHCLHMHSGTGSGHIAAVRRYENITAQRHNVVNGSKNRRFVHVWSELSLSCQTLLREYIRELMHERL